MMKWPRALAPKQKTRVSNCNNEIARIGQRREQLQKNLEEVKDKMSLLETQKKELGERKGVIEEQKQKIEKSIGDFRKKHKIGDDEGINKEIDDIDMKV